MANTKNSEDTSKGIWLITKDGKFSKLFLSIFVIIFAGIGSYLSFNTWAAKPAGKSSKTARSISSLSISPASQKASAGSTLALQIWADTGSQSVNSVQANLTYPTDKLNFVNIDDANSSFGIKAESRSTDGTIYIARGSIGSLNGHLYVATLNFKVTASSGTANVKFTSGTALVSSTINKNVLGSSYGGSYQIAP